MKIISKEFNKGQTMLPKKYTCNGKNTNPPLNFADVHEDTKSLALIMEDIDAPSSSVVHWLVYNMLPVEDGIAAGHVPDSGVEGINDFGEKGYFGPCPPENETRRYKFTLFALEKIIDYEEDLNGVELIKSINNNIIEKAELTAEFKRVNDEIIASNMQASSRELAE